MTEKKVTSKELENVTFEDFKREIEKAYSKIQLEKRLFAEHRLRDKFLQRSSHKRGGLKRSAKQRLWK